MAWHTQGSKYKEFLQMKDYVSHKIRMQKTKPSSLITSPNYRQTFLKYMRKNRERKLRVNSKILRKENLRIFKRLENIDLKGTKLKAKKRNNPRHEFSLDSVRGKKRSNDATGDTRNIFTPRKRDIMTPEIDYSKFGTNFFSVQDQINQMREISDYKEKNTSFMSNSRVIQRNNFSNCNSSRSNAKVNPFVRKYFHKLRNQKYHKPDVCNVINKLATNFGLKNKQSNYQKSSPPKMGGQQKRKIFSTSILCSSGVTTMHTANNMTRQNTKSELYEENEGGSGRKNRHLSPASNYIPILTQSEHRKIKNLSSRREVSPMVMTWDTFK
ncbi:unnamed protein product [Moneuplotes crassus]|uniref:Uncharacterized protein n=1 Tax=Euplotes crassus TaxID=5936 RepID=A0AAD1U3W2_EUPCR|nr:unnamed protein product [Moneuplotes crassus]